jgi:hypothetical protein
VTMTKCRWRGPGGRVGLLVLTAALSPLPVAASDAATGHTTPTARTSLHDAVARAAVTAAKAPIARTTERRADKGSADKGTAAFFKTGPGIVVLAVMAAGTGYVVYSANHDKITSAGRK